MASSALRRARASRRVSDIAKLESVVSSMRSTWNDVKPEVTGAGGAASGKMTDALVVRIEAARAAQQFAALTKPFLDVADELEKPCEKK